jgi:hypothetical protein
MSTVASSVGNRDVANESIEATNGDTTRLRPEYKWPTAAASESSLMIVL